MNVRLLSVCMLSVLGFACNSQVGPSYQGDPLLTVRGQIVATAAATSSPQARPAEAALLWLSVRPPFVSLVGTSVTVKGDFPMGFEINVFTPPSARELQPTDPTDDAFLTDPSYKLDPATTPAYGVARIVALASGADRDNVQLGDILGVSNDTEVLYNSQTVDPGSPGGKALAAQSLPLEAGYHLLALHLRTKDEELARIRCASGGVCQKTHLPPAAPTIGVASLDRMYDLCLEATPGAMTCDNWVLAQPWTDDQAAQTMACLLLAATHPGTLCNAESELSPAPPGATSTVVMGASLLDAWQ